MCENLQTWIACHSKIGEHVGRNWFRHAMLCEFAMNKNGSGFAQKLGYKTR
jgi:hypothetical protein